MNDTPIIPAWQWNRVPFSGSHYEMHTDTYSFVANIFGVGSGYEVIIADREGDPIHTIEDIDTLKAAKMAGYRSLLGHC
jgi:hypothetical protein